MREVSVYNNSGEIIPPYAVMQIEGAQAVATGKLVKVTKPDPTDDNAGYLLNGASEIPIGKTGVGIAPVDAGYAYYDNANTPAIGENWGPQASSWKLKKDELGFQIIGGHGSERVLVRITPSASVQIVKMNSTVGPGKAGSGRIQKITNTPPVSSGDSITVADVSPTKDIVVVNFRPNYLAVGVTYIAHRFGAFWVVENDACFQDFMS